MMQIIYFFLVALTGFIFWKFVSGKHEGEDGHAHSLRFTFGRYTFWLHHWVYCAIISIVLLVVGIHSLFIHGFLLGGVAQGLTYKDRFYIFFKTKNYPFREL